MTQAQALDILKTGANVFLTGEPGSGKTYVVNEYVGFLKESGLSVAVTASTGIAATHINGFTIHSWSGIGIKKRLTPFDLDILESNERLYNRITKTDVLIIDEISMLDALTINCIDAVCRRIRRDERPFGGLQVVLVGDFFQLPPVSSAGENPAQFAFLADAWQSAKFLVCYLSEQHRQEDSIFLGILSAMRRNCLTAEHLTGLDNCSHDLSDRLDKNITKLFPHNENVDRINSDELSHLPGEERNFNMKKVGRPALTDQLERGCLSPAELKLKTGAAVMFTKNSPAGSFVNGTLGEVAGFDKESGYPVIKTRRGRQILAEPMEWTIEDGNKILARLIQVPLRLAWAMTVHKSQGMSLDAVFIDLRQAFVAGQGYVALSRVRSLTGLYLAGYNQAALQVDESVLAEDEIFRRLSSEAAEIFSRLSLKELEKMHNNFVNACGGKIVKKKTAVKRKPADNAASKKYCVGDIRKNHTNAYRAWSPAEDFALKNYFLTAKNKEIIAERLGRQPGAIRARLKKLGLDK